MSLASRFVTALTATLPRLPFEAAGILGDGFGHIVWALDRRHRRVATDNLEVAFPGRSGGWRRRTCRRCFAQVGRTAFEMLWSPALDDVGVERTGQLRGTDRLRRHLAEGKGVLLASGHFGNWELMGLSLGRIGVRLHVIARPLDDGDLDAVVERLRRRTGNRVISKDRAVRGALRALRAGDAVAVLSDQNTLRSDAVFVPFFGRQAASTPLVGHLHLRTGAPVLPAFAVPSGRRYRYTIDEPITVEATDRREAVREVTASVTATIEAYVRRHPEAWLWMHDRWRTRPE